MREAEIVQLIEKLKEQIDSQLAPVHGSRQRWAANELIDYIRDEYCESDSSTRPPRAQEFRYRKFARDAETPALPPDLEEGAEELDEIVLRAVNFLHTEVMRTMRFGWVLTHRRGILLFGSTRPRLVRYATAWKATLR